MVKPVTRDDPSIQGLPRPSIVPVSKCDRTPIPPATDDRSSNLTTDDRSLGWSYFLPLDSSKSIFSAHKSENRKTKIAKAHTPNDQPTFLPDTDLP
jgi:hypothetical protein